MEAFYNVWRVIVYDDTMVIIFHVIIMTLVGHAYTWKRRLKEGELTAAEP